MRHQPGNDTNCINKQEFENIYKICDSFKTINIHRVFTSYPESNHHIKQVQTASNLCTLLGKNVELFNNAESLPEYLYGDVLIVWTHSDIQSILRKFGYVGVFEWPHDNYEGCLIMNDFGWEFNDSFFEKKRRCMLMDMFCHI